MSYRGAAGAPKGYVPGLGRGAAGFTTRSDIGPIADPNITASGTGSRASELFRMKQQQQEKQQSLFGAPPQGYVPGAGRGAGVNLSSENNKNGVTGLPNKDVMVEGEWNGNGQNYDDEDEEADLIYEAVDERMSSRRKKRNLEGSRSSTARIGEQFRELKEKLKEVSAEEWDAIPDIGDYSLKHKQRRREDVFTPLPDTILGQKSAANADPSAGRAIAGNSAVEDSGFRSVVSNMSGLAEARGTVLGMSLDKMCDSVSSKSVIDPKGYLTSLSNVKVASNAELSDINKARLLLKSTRSSNPKHGPAWIASARVEEAANKLNKARKLIQDGCEACPTNEDVWLEAARIHPVSNAKIILASALRHIPLSVKVFLAAKDLETNLDAKKSILRKALEAIPTSVTLWKAAIELEDAADALVLLQLAVEKVPHSVDMWLALAKLETYKEAKAVLNRARRVLPAEKSIWIAAAKLEESQQTSKQSIDKIIDNGIQSLLKNDAVISRDQWLKEAEVAEFQSNSPLTSAAIVKYTVGMGVDPEDRLRTWSTDASAALSRGAVGTSRALLSHALAAFPTKKKLWIQAVELEKAHGTNQNLDEVLKAASERLPRVELFWLVRAKEKWTNGEIEMSRTILTQAFAANPDSESVWLAAAKLEWETGEVERARVLLQRARERAPSDRVYMKSALLERQCHKYQEALALLDEGISKYRKFPKLYLMAGQICSENLKLFDRARSFYQNGIQNCHNSFLLWKHASSLEEQRTSVMKARSLLELARLKNSYNPELWLESIRLEKRAGNDKQASTLMAKALKECPLSGLLLAESILTASRVDQKSKSATAIKKCPEHPLVISAVATIFSSERKIDKARKWFQRAVVLDPDFGDSWAKYYKFEKEYGTDEQQQNVKERCIDGNPKHGEIWCSVSKHMDNTLKTVQEILELVSETIEIS